MAWRAICSSLFAPPSFSILQSKQTHGRFLHLHLSLLFSSLSSPAIARAISFFPSAKPPFVRPRRSAPSTYAYSRISLLSSESESTASTRNTSNDKKINTKVNFSLSGSDDDEDNAQNSAAPAVKGKVIDQSKLPPPYDPFNKKPAIEEPQDPKDLQGIFHKMRTEGFINNAVKMFDALSKDGLTHEALQLFAEIKDKGEMPEVVAHTAVVEAYANAGQPKEALKVFLRMLASGVAPNAYTYAVLIKGLAADARLLGDAKKYMMEMMVKGMRPNAATYTAVLEGLAREHKEEEAWELLEHMKTNGFVPDEKAVREVLNTKRGPST